MDLHQAGDRPDWANIPPHKRNPWQQFAADTQGIGTPGNALSVLGFILVVIGLWVVLTGRLWTGTLFVCAGRIADLIDGAIAQRTGTKSPLGRLLDAGLDKLGALLALFVFTFVNVLPWWLALAIAAQNIANIIVGTYAPWHHIVLNPSRPGKLATSGYWIAIVTFVVGELLAGAGVPLLHSVTVIAAYIIAISSLAAGIVATVGYVKIVHAAYPHQSKVDTHHEV